MTAQIGRAVVMVQQKLAGTPIDHLDACHLEHALTLNALQRGALAGWSDILAINLHLRDDGPGYCLHEPLRRFSGSTAALERRIARIGDEHPAQLPGVDAVHQDFHLGNLLATQGRITGVVDWDGAGRGDHRFDLVTLRFGVYPDHADRDVADRLDALLDAMPESVLRPPGRT